MQKAREFKYLQLFLQVSANLLMSSYALETQNWNTQHFHSTLMVIAFAPPPLIHFQVVENPRVCSLSSNPMHQIAIKNNF